MSPLWHLYDEPHHFEEQDAQLDAAPVQTAPAENLMFKT
jgi:hypothetical protein